MPNRNLTYLRILLVLSIIGSGTMFISNALTALLEPTMQAFYAANADRFPEEFATAADMVFLVPRLYYALCALLYALSLAGVVMMWQLKVPGFHCYTLAQLLLLVVPLLFLGRAYLSIGDIMLTVLFVGTYWLIFRTLGLFGPKNEETT